MSDNTVKITGIIAAAIVLLAIVGLIAYNLTNVSKGQQIVVDGSSVLNVNPDLVTIHFNAQTKGATAKEANAANSEITDALITELVKQGFERKDIQTESLNVYEDIRWEYNKQKSYGYIASHQIKVVLNSSESSKIGDTIDAGVNSGALLSYINFELSDAKQNEYKALALKQAGQDAKTKAQAIADGLGLRVSEKPISVSTQSLNYEPWRLYSAAEGVASSDNAMEAKVAVNNIVPGSQQVSGQIQVTYRIY